MEVPRFGNSRSISARAVTLATVRRAMSTSARPSGMDSAPITTTVSVVCQTSAVGLSLEVKRYQRASSATLSAMASRLVMNSIDDPNAMWALPVASP